MGFGHRASVLKPTFGAKFGFLFLENRFQSVTPLPLNRRVPLAHPN